MRTVCQIRAGAETLDIDVRGKRITKVVLPPAL
jgi:hypothetical protein